METVNNSNSIIKHRLEEGGPNTPASSLSQEDYSFIKAKYLYDNGLEIKGSIKEGDIEVIKNTRMVETLGKKYEKLTEEEKNYISTFVKKRREQTFSSMKPFIWNEEEVIKNKTFAMDHHRGLFFYGFLLPKTIDHTIKGKKIGKKQIHTPALILSNRTIEEESERLKEDMNLSFDNIPSMLRLRWRLEDIHSYLTGRVKDVNPKDLLREIEEQYSKYLFIRLSTWYKIHALWDIGSYLYQLFEAYPFFELRGIAGTGKTKAMVISSYISFNGGQIMVNPSESTLFRETDEVRGTKYFDEAEKLFVFNKITKRYEGDNRTELINASYTKEARVPRQEKIGNRFITKWYSPYSPTMLGSINGLYGATETRAITRITTKSPNEDNRGELEPSEDRNKEVWGDIRDKCYRFALDNWKQIKDLYNNFPKDIGLKRRDYQIWKPLLTIAKFISEEVYKEVLDFAKEITQRRTEDLVHESSFDYMCLEALKVVIENEPDTDKRYVDRVKFAYCNLKGDEEGKKNAYLNRNISKHLDNLGFKEVRNRDSKGSYFAVTKDIYNEIVSPICPNLAFLSTLSTLSTQPLIKEGGKYVDSMTIHDDTKNKSVTIM